MVELDNFLLIIEIVPDYNIGKSSVYIDPFI